MINVDETRLAEVLGGHVDLAAHDEKTNHQLVLQTARALTDTSRAGTPSAKFNNALYWVERAYEDGFQAGIHHERKRWERKISDLFGL
jgi:hypothetical protein